MRRTIIYNKNNFTILFFKLFIRVSVKETAHPTFHLRPITTGKAFDVFKASWFRRFTNIGNFSPAAIIVVISVNRTLLCLTPLHFSPFMCKVLLGSSTQKRPNSSALHMSFSLYLDRIIGRYVSFHAFVISGVADRDSPNTSLNEILYQVFQACNQPPDAWNFSIFNYFAKPRAFSCKIVSLIGMFSDICISKHP